MTTQRIDGGTGIRDIYQESKVTGEILQKGVFRGEKVQVKQDATSLIADAAEELTFSAAETVEKKIEKRRISKERKSDQLKQIEKLLKTIPDINKKELLEWCERIRKNPPQSSKDLLDLLNEDFDDVTHQDLALSVLEELLSKEGDDELLKAVRSAKNLLEAEHGAEIRAGLNISVTAQSFSQQGLGKTSELRDFYRSTVLKYEGLTKTFESILENFPDKNFLEAVNFLIKAVGSDLHSKGPSIEPSELKIILDDLYHIESLGNLYRKCDDLLNRTVKGFGLKLKTTSKDIVGHILKLKDASWLTSSQIEELPSKLGIKNLSAQIYFLQGLRETVRLMPMKLFSDNNLRLNMLDRMQEAIDALIEREE
ncbi:MAG: type III secretion system gatekeeper subunit SctW [Deltaproteobacteria bacterium]|nr:type III secretion system gatekeeper subunit SctW [Deltaproteobacteria bacterium]